jgi:hypothetical protein
MLLSEKEEASSRRNRNERARQRRLCTWSMSETRERERLDMFTLLQLFKEGCTTSVAFRLHDLNNSLYKLNRS